MSSKAEVLAELLTVNNKGLVVDGKQISELVLTNGDIVSEGKSKKFYKITDRAYFMVFKPHARSITSKREENVPGTDISRLETTLVLMNMIEHETDIRTALLYNEILEVSGMKGLLVAPAKTIPIEFIKRYYAEGSIVRLFPSLVEQGQKLNVPLSKYDFKQDIAVSGVDDPTLNESYITGLGLLSKEQFETANVILDMTAESLNKYLDKVGIKLIDFKMEIGFTEFGMTIIDEISQDCIRANLKETGESLTKDAFRQMKTADEVLAAYKRFYKLITL